jgi:hypothetical protein
MRPILEIETDPDFGLASGFSPQLEYFNSLMDNASDDDELAQLFAANESNIAIDALFIVAQHDGCKWADACRHVKDLCRATRAETGLWSALARVHYCEFHRALLMWEAQRGCLDRVQWLLARGAPRDACDDDGLTPSSLPAGMVTLKSSAH